MPLLRRYRGMPPRAKEEDAMQIPARRWLQKLEGCISDEGVGRLGESKERRRVGREGIVEEKRGGGMGGVRDGPAKKLGHELRGAAGPTRRATDTSSQTTTWTSAAGGSGRSLGQRGEPTPPGSMVVSGTGAISGRRVEEQKRWRVAQGFFGRSQRRRQA